MVRPSPATPARLAGLLAAVVVLSGCGGDPLAGPSASPEPSASASATASADATPSATATASASASASAESSAEPTETPTPTADPAIAEVEAFAEHVLDVANKAFSTGETKPLKALSAKDCKTCSNWLSNISGVYGAGGRIRGGQATVLDSSAEAPAKSADVAEVKVKVKVTKQTDLDAKGKTLATTPAAEGLLIFTLERAGSDWRVREIRPG